MCEVSVPPSLSGAFEGSFAYKTIRDRMPAILVRVIDDLHKLQRQQLLQNGQDGANSLKDAIGQLSKLRYEMMTNKDLAPLVGEEPDIAAWNAYIELETAAHSALPRWFQNAWLFVECYMYRKINQIIRSSPHLQDYDQFSAQKNASLADSTNAVKVLLEFTHTLEMTPSGGDVEELKTTVAEYFELSLWGNKCDLSITGGADNAQKVNPLDQLLGLRRFILINDFEQHLWPHLAELWKSGGASRMDIVLDNAGFELVADLALAEVLLALGFARTVHLHIKLMPWFVSDATAVDVHHTLEQLSQSRCLAVQTMGGRWQQRLRWRDQSATGAAVESYPPGSLIVNEDPFWTMPHDYSQMAAAAPRLHADLTGSALVIFKGDLNYRKLVGDRQWRRDTPFVNALCGFVPTSLLSLRTLKADVVVGLSARTADELDLADKEWMVTGTYGVVQFCAAAPGSVELNRAKTEPGQPAASAAQQNGEGSGKRVSFVVAADQTSR